MEELIPYQDLIKQLKDVETLRQSIRTLTDDNAELRQKLNTDELIPYKELIKQLKDVETLRQSIRILTDDNADLRQKLNIEEDKNKQFENKKTIFCRTCKQKNEHINIYEKRKLEEGETAQDYVEFLLQRYECSGCKTEVTVEIKFDFEGIKLEERWIPKYEKWFLETKEIILNNLNNHTENENYIKSTYENTITCYNAKMEKQCAMSVRTLIEEIGLAAGIKDELISEGMKEYNIKIQHMVDRMLSKGMITNSMANILKELRFLGNEATHSLTRPPMKELELAIRIVEHIVENIYVIQKIYHQLKSQSDIRRSGTTT
jgi:hypothetical protein